MGRTRRPKNTLRYQVHNVGTPLAEHSHVSKPGCRDDHSDDQAITAVRTAITGARAGVQGLRIMVRAGGCVGLKYSMGLVRQPAPDDLVIEQGGVRLFIDTASQPHIKGTTVDFVVGLANSGFTFNNPNATAKCSCGKSFC